MNYLGKLSYLDKAYFTIYNNRNRIGQNDNEFKLINTLWKEHLIYYDYLINPYTLVGYIYSKLTIL